VFYALADARTPTVINGLMTALKIPLLLACPLLLDGSDVVLGLTAVNSMSYVVGAVVGQLWLRHRLGRLETKRALLTLGKSLLAAIPAVALVLALRPFFDIGSALGAWLYLITTTVIVLVVMSGALLALRTPELTAAARPVLSRFTRRQPRE
jgi:putative peptidoglycan lipid II flippase